MNKMHAGRARAHITSACAVSCAVMACASEPDQGAAEDATAASTSPVSSLQVSPSQVSPSQVPPMESGPHVPPVESQSQQCQSQQSPSQVPPLAATASNSAGGAGGGSTCGSDAAGSLFTRRIAPLLAEDRPKSCNDCHLSGVDLNGFVRDDACESMACLVEDGLVNLEDPASSTLLGWIRRATPDSELITQAVIDEEYSGVLEWIEFSARCGEQACPGATCGPRDSLPHCPDEPLPAMPTAQDLPSDCDDHSIESLFKATVYAQRGRCSPCHVDTAEEKTMPGYPWIHIDGTCDQGALETLRDVAAQGYMNLEQPAQSLLLLKPLAGELAHAGAAKFHDENDPTYQAFFTFIDYYAGCARGTPP